MEFERAMWEELTEEEKAEALHFAPRTLHPDLVEAFVDCVEDAEEAAATSNFNIG